MAIVIEDRCGERKIIMELTEDEAALIKTLLGKCNTCGVTGETKDTYRTFSDIPNLPTVHLVDCTRREYGSGINITYNISHSDF